MATISQQQSKNKLGLKECCMCYSSPSVRYLLDAKTISDKPVIMWVECPMCGIRTPVCLDTKDAVAYWNWLNREQCKHRLIAPKTSSSTTSCKPEENLKHKKNKKEENEEDNDKEVAVSKKTKQTRKKARSAANVDVAPKFVPATEIPVKKKRHRRTKAEMLEASVKKVLIAKSAAAADQKRKRGRPPKTINN